MTRVLRSCSTFAVVLLASALGLCASARADVFGPISLVSSGHLGGSPTEQQAQQAADSVISADGRYVAFDGTVAGKTGIFRRDLASGEISLVVEGEALLPSISEEGRYISFTTAERLDEENDTNAAPDVYVRDMDLAQNGPCPSEWEQQREQCAFTLASAVNGSGEGLSYEYPAEEYDSGVAFNEEHYGSLASGRSALSANGSEVAFETTGASDLNGREQPELPRLQVMVRYLQSKHTELVTTAYRDGQQTSEAVPSSPDGYYGAVYPGASAPPEFPLSSPYWGASLSANGSTVAWMGNQIGEQVPLLASESLAPEYTEPLWRRIGEGASSPTRRVTGGSDPSSPQCEQSGEVRLQQPATLSDPCQGPFETTGGLSGIVGLFTGSLDWNFVPQLSANGETVAFLATARYIAGGEEFKSAESSDDLYVANMAAGLTRVQALRRVTAIAGGTQTNGGRTSPIVDFGISPDGTQLAFATSRTVFPLGSPALVTPPEATSFLTELYSADLANNTLTRATIGYEGQRTEAVSGEDTTASPSFSAADSLLSFCSTEDNLIYGDGNAASDAFVVPKLSFSSSPAAQQISSPPPNPALEMLWSLGVTATPGNGSVTLYAEVPAAGSLRALADSAVPVGSASHKASRGHRSRGHGSRTHGHAAQVVATRPVAVASANARAAGLIELSLKLPKGYWKLAEGARGLLSNVQLTFSSPGHPTLSQSIQVSFHRKPSKTAAQASKKRRGRRR